MAKNIKSIKLGAHVYDSNRYKVSFQLIGNACDTRYLALFGEDGISLPIETSGELNFLDIHERHRVIAGLKRWSFTPRREFKGKTPAEYMLGIIIGMRDFRAASAELKKERRAKIACSATIPLSLTTRQIGRNEAI